MERLAVNLIDLDRVVPLVRDKMLKGRFLPTIIEIHKDRVDPEPVVEFACNSEEDLLSAATICDVLRSHDRAAGDFPTRVFIYRKAWVRVPTNVALTMVNKEGKCSLNPKVFSIYNRRIRNSIPIRALRPRVIMPRSKQESKDPQESMDGEDYSSG